MKKLNYLPEQYQRKLKTSLTKYKMRTETADKPKLKKMFKTEQTEIKTPNPEISEF